MKFQGKERSPGWKALLPFTLPLWLLSSSPVVATDLTIGAAGRVSIELIGSEAAFRNTLSVISPSVAVPDQGCRTEPAGGLPGVHVVSEKFSQRGCRISLDSDPVSAGIQPFAAGTTFRFGMCAQTDPDPDCEFVWSSNPSSNSDGADHVITTDLYPVDLPGRAYQLAWEDRDRSNGDFNDLIVVVRVGGDSDGDGLWDDWERFGVDTDGDGAIDLDLPGLGANPMRKDIFLEIDWMDCALAGSDCDDSHNHLPIQDALDGVVQAFANSGVDNPDGSKGISLHIDVSNSFPHYNYLAIGCAVVNPNLNFATIKADPANFGTANPRRFAYHYALFAHQLEFRNGTSGCGEIPGNDFEVTLGGGWGGGGGTLMQQAGTLMHELGHNLGLNHGGDEDDGLNFKPNYISVMNYRYQFGIPPTDPDGRGPLTARIDYSKEALNDLVETALDEPVGIGDGTDNAFWFCPDGTTKSGAGDAALDWNCDGNRRDMGVDSDVNGSGEKETLKGFWDWANLKFDFQNTAAYETGVHFPLPEMELDLETYEATVAPELSIAKTALPTTVLTGSNVTYTITVTDQRPEQAVGVRVTDVLPPSMTLVSCTATGGGTCGGTGRNVTVDFPVLPGGNSAAITLVANLSCAVADGTVIPNTATADFSQSDPDPSNNSAKAIVTASNPPPVISGVGTDKTKLSPPNHKMVDVTVSYRVTDNCGVPVCRLAVTSNEPVEDPGSGNTSPDWEVLDEHRVRLRAERSGTGSGRIYTIGIACTDEGGAISTASAAVTVPR